KITKNPVTLIFFGLNPLVLIETFVSGHNDIVMMFFAVWALYLLQKKKIIFAFSVLLLSILIKYSTLFLLPVYLYTSIQMVYHKKINWNRVYALSFCAMILIFF